VIGEHDHELTAMVHAAVSVGDHLLERIGANGQ
jgi:hypothetical protein